MKRSRKFAFWLVLLPIIVFCVLLRPVASCSLAQHDWDLRLSISFTLDCPLITWAELDHLEKRIPASAAASVVWVVGEPDKALPALTSMLFFPNVLARLPWEVVSKGAGVLSYSKAKRDDGQVSVVLGADRYRVIIAFWSDKSSGYRCHQLVFMQEGRMRAIFPSAQHYLAEQQKVRTWLSCIFYQVPIPGRFISIAGFPHKSVRASLWEDYELVNLLLRQGKLALRPDSSPDPYSDDFPPIEETTQLSVSDGEKKL